MAYAVRITGGLCARPVYWERAVLDRQINRTMAKGLTWSAALKSTLAVAQAHPEDKCCLCFEQNSSGGQIYEW